MPIPASYTEATLKDFMLAALKQLGAVLGLTTSDFDEAINDTLLAYGVTDITNATDIPKLRAIAKVEAWKVAVVQAGSRIDWGEAGAQFKQSQYRSAAATGLEMALSEAIAAGHIIIDDGTANNVITVGQMSTYDPYA